MTYMVFVSLAEDDIHIGEEIKKYLARINIYAYIQSRTVGFGAVTLGDRIKNAIRNSRFLLAILTKSGASSEWVNQEIGYAQGLGIPVLPLKARDVELKGFIEGYKYVHLVPANLRPLLANLIRMFKEELEIESATVNCPNCLKPTTFIIRDVSLTELEQKGLVLVRDCETCKQKLQMEPTLLDVSLR